MGCIKLHKCGLFSNKTNGMASMETKGGIHKKNKIMMMLATMEMVEPNTGSIRGLNLGLLVLGAFICLSGRYNKI